MTTVSALAADEFPAGTKPETIYRKISGNKNSYIAQRIRILGSLDSRLSGLARCVHCAI